jgi:hypothetical protein
MSGITNPAEKYFKDGLWTFDGTVWRPQNQLFAYRDSYWQQVSNLSPGAGIITLNGTAVPAGEVWVVTNMYARNDTTATSTVALLVTDTVTNFYVDDSLYYALPRSLRWSGQAVLKATWLARAIFSGVVAGDDLYAWFSGYKFKIAE